MCRFLLKRDQVPSQFVIEWRRKSKSWGNSFSFVTYPYGQEGMTFKPRTSENFALKKIGTGNDLKNFAAQKKKTEQVVEKFHQKKIRWEYDLKFLLFKKSTNGIISKGVALWCDRTFRHIENIENFSSHCSELRGEVTLWIVDISQLLGLACKLTP